LAALTKDSARPDSANSTSDHTLRALHSPVAVAAFLAVALAGLAADLASKQLVFDELLGHREVADQVRALQQLHGADLGTDRTMLELRRVGLLQRPFAPGVDFTLSTNPGVVFGWRLPPWLVLVATALTVGVVGFFFATAHRRARTLQVGLAMILAGALGNLYDRLCGEVAVPGLAGEPLRGQVRDFIDCSGLYYPWIFNVADILLVVGVGLLLVHWFVNERRQLPAK